MDIHIAIFAYNSHTLPFFRPKFCRGGRTDLTLTTNTTSADGPTNTGYWTDTATQTALDVDFTNYSLSGTGISSSPYLIQSETDLAFLSWTIYNNKAYNGNVTGRYSFYLGKYFKQTKDLDLSAYYWQPIGICYLRDGTYASRYFSGNYDGGGHTISGLYTPAMPEGLTTTQQYGYSYQGLFGLVNGSGVSHTISNIGVIDSFIQGYEYVGGIVGRIERTSSSSPTQIIRCYNSSIIQSTGDYVGGIVGAGTLGVTILNCYNTGSISSISNDYVGGIIGESRDTEIGNCYNSGSITGNGQVGGIAGIVYGTIYNCYNIGDINGLGNYIGGIMGGGYDPRNSSTVKNCYNTGSISGSAYFGGIVGDVVSLTINNSYYGGDCSSSTGGVNGEEQEGTKFIENLDDLAKNETWYSNSATNEDGSLVWDALYPWDLDRTWGFSGDPNINQGYPSIVPFKYYWTDAEAQTALGVDFTNYFLSGSGTAESPYKISSETDLAFLSWTIYTNNVYGGSLNKQTDSNGNYYYSNCYFKQTANLNMEEYNWQPIGIYYLRVGSYVRRYFSGNYDGGGFIVSGLYTPVGSGSGYSYQGLFGYVIGYNSNISIKNIGIIDSSIKGKFRVGGLAGYAENVNVANCYNFSSINSTDSTVDDYSYAGGLIGSAKNLSLQNSQNYGSVNGPGMYVGGVIGRIESTSSIENCYNTGTVTGGGAAGGVVGGAYTPRNASVTITNCYNTGAVNGNGDYVGGVVGYAYYYLTIDNCYNTGAVNGNGDYVGGVVGYAVSSSTITNCYNTGSVTGNNSVGGVVGHTYAKSSSSPVTITNCGVETTQISGNSNVGVLVGYGDSTTTITNCYGIVGVDIDFASVGTYDNCVWITNVDGVVNKYYHGTNFSAFAWFNPNSCPIPKSLSSLGQFWTGDITPTLTDSSEWHSV